LQLRDLSKVNRHEVIACHPPTTAETVLAPTHTVSQTHTPTHTHQYFPFFEGTRWRIWLKYCATNRNVAVSIGIFHWHNPSGRTMDLGLTQPLVEMSTRIISYGGWGGGGRCVGLTTLPPSYADCLEIWDP